MTGQVMVNGAIMTIERVENGVIVRESHGVIVRESPGPTMSSTTFVFESSEAFVKHFEAWLEDREVET